MKRKAETIVMTILIGAAYGHVALGQPSPPASSPLTSKTSLRTRVTPPILATNLPVSLTHPTKFATNPSVTHSAGAREFSVNVAFGDIVAVNGQPAKGVCLGRPKHSVRVSGLRRQGP